MTDFRSKDHILVMFQGRTQGELIDYMYGEQDTMTRHAFWTGLIIGVIGAVVIGALILFITD